MRYPLDIGQDALPILQASARILKLGTLLLQQITHKAANPAALAKHEKDLPSEQLEPSVEVCGKNFEGTMSAATATFQPKAKGSGRTRLHEALCRFAPTEQEKAHRFWVAAVRGDHSDFMGVESKRQWSAA